MSLYVYRERKACVTEKQLFSGTNCFLRAFALKFLVMINGNVLGCNLLLAVLNSPSPSGAFFFISVTSWPRRSIASLLVPSCLNVLCWAAFPNPCPRYYVRWFLQIPPRYLSRQAGGSCTSEYSFSLYKKAFQESYAEQFSIFGFEPSPFWTWRRWPSSQVSPKEKGFP